MAGVLEAASPNIGHADAGHNPDWPGLVWKDGRLLGELSRVDNRARFLDAAKYLFAKYRLFVDPKCKTPQMEKDAEELLADLDDAIGYRDQTNGYKQARIAKYSELSTTKKYGDKELPEYDEHSWLEEAVNESVRGLRDTSDNKLLRWDPLTDVYTWKDCDSYVESDWYKFQEAVKEHQDQSWDIMKDDTFGKMDLKEL